MWGAPGRLATGVGRNPGSRCARHGDLGSLGRSLHLDGALTGEAARGRFQSQLHGRARLAVHLGCDGSPKPNDAMSGAGTSPARRSATFPAGQRKRPASSGILCRRQRLLWSCGSGQHRAGCGGQLQSRDLGEKSASWPPWQPWLLLPSRGGREGTEPPGFSTPSYSLSFYLREEGSFSGAPPTPCPTLPSHQLQDRLPSSLPACLPTLLLFWLHFSIQPCRTYSLPPSQFPSGPSCLLVTMAVTQ